MAPEPHHLHQLCTKESRRKRLPLYVHINPIPGIQRRGRGERGGGAGRERRRNNHLYIHQPCRPLAYISHTYMPPAFVVRRNSTSEESWGHDSLGTRQVTSPFFSIQKVYLSTKLGWRQWNKATHHKPAGLVRPSPWCAVCLHMYRASTVAVKHGTAGSTH